MTQSRARALRDAADSYDVLNAEAPHNEGARVARDKIQADPSQWLRDLANRQYPQAQVPGDSRVWPPCSAAPEPARR